MPEPQCATGTCPRPPLPESYRDPAPHCYWHASRAQKQAHADALAAAARVRQLAPELLAFVREVADWLDGSDCGTLGYGAEVQDQARVLLDRAEGETEARDG